MPALRIVATDANVLINLAYVERLDLLGSLPGYGFIAPPEALSEVIRDAPRARLESALRYGHIQKAVIEDLEALKIYAELRTTLGRGESACLALAATRGWFVASDEKRVFLREAHRLLGPGRVLDTPGLFLLAIRKGLLTVDEADEAKAILERCRFRMAFASFRELL